MMQFERQVRDGASAEAVREEKEFRRRSGG